MPDIAFRVVTQDEASGPLGRVKGALAEIEQQSGASHSALGKIAEGLSGIGAAVGGLDGIKEFLGSSLDAANELGESVKKLHDRFGGTVEDASHLREIFQLGGADPDKATAALGRLSKGLEDSGGKPSKLGKELSGLGVDFKDAQGNILPMAELLPRVSDVFSKMPDGPNKTALAMQLFGKQGADLIPVLNQGAAGMANLAKEGDKLGLTLSGENLESIHKNEVAHRQFSAALEGVKVQVGLALMPVLNQLMGWAVQGATIFNQAVVPAIRAFGELIQANVLPKLSELVSQVLPVVLKWFTEIGNWVKGTLVPIFIQFAELIYSRLLVYLKDLRDNVLPQLQKWFTEIGNWVKGTLVPAFTELASAVADKLKGPLQDVIDFLSQHEEIFRAIAIAIGIVAVGMAAFAVATGIATVAATAFAVVMAVVTSPITLIVAAIALLVLGIVELNKHWGDITKAIPQLGVAWTAVQQEFAKFTDWLGKTFIPDCQKALSGIQTAVSGVIDFIRQHWHEIQDLITPVLDFIKQFIVTAFDTIVGVIHTALDLITGIIKIAMDLIHGNWSQAWEDIKSLFKNVFNDIKGIISAQLDLFMALFRDSWTELTRIFTDIWPKLKELVSAGLHAIWQWIKDNWVNIIGTLLIGPIFLFRDQIADVLKAAGEKVLEGIVAIKDKVVHWGDDAKTWLFNVGKDLVQGLIDGIKAMGDDALKAIEGIGNGIISKIPGLSKSHSPSLVMYQQGVDLMTGLKQGLESQYTGILGSVDSFAGKLLGTMAKSTGSYQGALRTNQAGGDYGPQLTGEQIAGLILQAGGTQAEASIGAQIAMRESSGFTQIPALTPNDPNYGIWGGLFQFDKNKPREIGVVPGESPAAQAAHFLQLFRMNGGSDWTGGGLYPLPAPGPYLSGATTAGVPSGGGGSIGGGASSGGGGLSTASAPAAPSLWYAFGYSGQGTPPKAPAGMAWVTLPGSNVQTLQETPSALQTFAATGSGQGLAFARVPVGGAHPGEVGIRGGAQDWQWQLVDASQQTVKNTKQDQLAAAVSQGFGDSVAGDRLASRLGPPVGHAVAEALGNAPKAFAVNVADFGPGAKEGLAILGTRLVSGLGGQVRDVRTTGLEGAAVLARGSIVAPAGGDVHVGTTAVHDPGVQDATKSVGDTVQRSGSQTSAQLIAQQSAQDKQAAATQTALTRINQTLSPIEHQIDLGNQTLDKLLWPLYQLANDPKTPSEMRQELSVIGRGIEKGTLSLSDVKNNLANLNDPTNQIVRNTLTTATATTQTATSTAAIAQVVAPAENDTSAAANAARGVAAAQQLQRSLVSLGLAQPFPETATKPAGIPSFAGGGVMPYTGLAYLHAGEHVSTSAPPVVINISISAMDAAGVSQAMPQLARQLDLHLRRLGLKGLAA